MLHDSKLSIASFLVQSQYVRPIITMSEHRLTTKAGSSPYILQKDRPWQGKKKKKKKFTRLVMASCSL